MLVRLTYISREYELTVPTSQFLPQDRVSAFALMDSKELLKETERAVGGEALLEMHAKLAKDRVDEKKLQQVSVFLGRLLVR